MSSFTPNEPVSLQVASKAEAKRKKNVIIIIINERGPNPACGVIIIITLLSAILIVVGIVFRTARKQKAAPGPYIIR